MATDSDSAGQERNARKREEPMEKDNVSAQEIKTEDVYRKCCSCHMMKAWIHGRGKQRCVECTSLQMRISRIQVSDRAVRGWYTVRKNERVRFMEQAAGLKKDDLREAMLDAVCRLRKKRILAKLDGVCHLDDGSIADTGASEKAESAADSEPVVKRRRSNVKRPGEKKPDEKVRRKTPMRNLTSMQNERLVYVQGRLQEASVLLNASIREASKHKGTQVPTNTLDKAKAVTAEIVKLVTMASDMHATGKTPRGMFPYFFEDAKHAIDVAKEVFPKMNSLIVD